MRVGEKVLLEVCALNVDILKPEGPSRVVHSLSFSLEAGKTLGVVGESGSGKSMTARAAIGLLPPGATVVPVVRGTLAGVRILVLGR